MTGTEESGRTHAGWFDEAVALCAARFGHELPDRQLAGLRELVERLSAEFALDGPAACVDMLRRLPLDAPLVQRLLAGLTNKDSYFFRDAATVTSLWEDVLPALVERAEPTRTLRVWSAGCATGEEIYTLAILLHELLPDYDAWNVSLLATDIDQAALARARTAEYEPWSLRVTNNMLRRRYFEQRSDEPFRLKAKYQKSVSFELHNLADVAAPLPSPGRFDLILCRNVTIYFSARAQADVARTLSAALAPGGVWLSGSSDPTPRQGFSTRVLPGLLEHRAVASPDARHALTAALLNSPQGVSAAPLPAWGQMMAPSPYVTTLRPGSSANLATTLRPGSSAQPVREALAEAEKDTPLRKA